jgi:hypothetical protein
MPSPTQSNPWDCLLHNVTFDEMETLQTLEQSPRHMMEELQRTVAADALGTPISYESLPFGIASAAQASIDAQQAVEEKAQHRRLVRRNLAVRELTLNPRYLGYNSLSTGQAVFIAEALMENRPPLPFWFPDHLDASRREPRLHLLAQRRLDCTNHERLLKLHDPTLRPPTFDTFLGLAQYPGEHNSRDCCRRHLALLPFLPRTVAVRQLEDTAWTSARSPTLDHIAARMLGQ